MNDTKPVDSTGICSRDVMTKKNLGTAAQIVCKDLADLGPLKGAKNLESLSLDAGKKLKIKGTAKLSQRGIKSLYIDTP
ncbi:hypothetical protein [Paeniglutamicibacter sp. NPDC091659]|uniref:hypothetical protein n=1 Tax=Paeniglutamicibacter sp. NPDC091659 TaxID=3364389 RepID=UPI003828DD1E